MVTEDEKYIKRCIDLAYLGQGRVSPNPLVGCVIVKDGLILGEGYHEFYGGPHAEINAINTEEIAVKSKVNNDKSETRRRTSSESRELRDTTKRILAFSR